jgi:hypothetical protein
MKTNEQILSEVKVNGFITSAQIRLLKNRSNKDNKDVINYDEDFEGFSIDKESGEKGLQWLKSLLNSKGEPKANVSLGYREIDIIQNASNEDFEFMGFYDDGGYGYHNFKPIYRVCSMEYIPYANGQKIYVIG